MRSIVYLCEKKGNNAFKPDDSTVPGSETAIFQLTLRWAAAGAQVRVYSLCPPIIYKGVQWLADEDFNGTENYDVVILWRQAGFNMFKDYPLLSARFIGLDLHDGLFDVRAFAADPLSTRVDKLFVKSRFHKSLFDSCGYPESRFAVL